MTPTAPWRDFPDAEQLTIPVMKTGMTDFLITGDAARNKIQTLPGAGLGGGSTTVQIELPANWDKLMSDLGYKPLADFKLKGVVKKANRPSSADNEETRWKTEEHSEGRRRQGPDRSADGHHRPRPGDSDGYRRQRPGDFNGYRRQRPNQSEGYFHRRQPGNSRRDESPL